MLYICQTDLVKFSTDTEIKAQEGFILKRQILVPDIAMSESHTFTEFYLCVCVCVIMQLTISSVHAGYDH